MENGWSSKINPIVDLKLGYTVTEDVHFVYLNFHGHQIAIFNDRVTLAEIQKACFEHLEQRKLKKEVTRWDYQKH